MLEGPKKNLATALDKDADRLVEMLRAHPTEQISEMINFVGLVARQVSLQALFANAWHPMESAPKDGTAILLHDGCEGDNPTVCMWDCGTWIACWDHRVFKIESHTIWSPLPISPA